MSPISRLKVAVLLLVLGGGFARAATWRVDADPGGQVWGMVHDGAFVPVEGFFQAAAPNWRPYAGPADLRDVSRSEAEGARHWSGRFSLAGGKFRYEQTVREGPDGAELAVRVRAEDAAELDGVFYRFHVPAVVFAGGRCRFVTPEGESEAPLPEAGGRGRVKAGKAERLLFQDAAGNLAFEIALDRERQVRVDASPGWLQPFYDVLVWVWQGPMEAGQEAPFACLLSLAGQADRSPVHLTLDASQERYRLEGFGGNYCYWPMGPATPRTLDDLSPAWARSQMSLDAWEPRNDNDDPEEINWPAFEGRHAREWLLQTDLRAATEIAARDVPFVISVWRVPAWMTAGGQGKGPVNPAAAPELAESVVAYLLYLRREHGVEPALFSFNEPDLGMIRDPGDYRDIVKVIGRRISEAGLKTRILAADTGNARGDKVDYGKPLLEDPEGRQYVGGLSFHSWGGAAPETYRAWAALARSNDLPLFVAELGWNAMAHRGEHSMHTLRYAVEELRMYQELLLYAEPQVLLEWEYGGSYPILLEQDGELAPTLRYHLVKHYAVLTPRPSAALGTGSDSADVLVTAFRGAGEGGRAAYAVHVANLGADRPAVLEGLPPGLRAVRAVQTTPDARYQSFGAPAVENGKLALRLPALSLLTLCWEE